MLRWLRRLNLLHPEAENRLEKPSRFFYGCTKQGWAPGVGVTVFCFECVASAQQVPVSSGIHRPVKKAADHAVMILYVEMAVFKKEGSRIAARFLPQSGFIVLILKDKKFVEQQNKKGRSFFNDRPFGILVPRRGLEPPHPKAHGPEPCASTNSATWAYRCMLMAVPKAFNDFTA